MTFPPRHILVPVEPTRESEAAVSAAAALAAALDAELTLLGVAAVAQAPMSSEGALLEVIEQRDDQQVLDQLTQERLDEAAANLPDTIRTHTAMTWDPPGSGIAEAAREQAPDLIVLPMRHGGFLAHVLHDHTDQHVLRHAEVPVLIVPVDPHSTETPAREPTRGELA
jgi:nucleotide-binding universal stress UspA family protein